MQKTRVSVQTVPQARSFVAAFAEYRAQFEEDWRGRRREMVGGAEDEKCSEERGECEEERERMWRRDERNG
eukprot:1230756-Rhodomonas_salina.1